MRYYPLPGGTVTAVRTGATNTDFKYEIIDQNDTPTLYLDATVQIPTWRQYTPYGEARGTTTSWPDNHGFLNKPLNTSTGLTEIGARNYDPTTGRFISPDPALDPNDPQQLNGYTYAGDNPISRSDPTGLCPADRCIGYGQNPGQSGPKANPVMPGRQAGDDYLPQGLTAQQIDEIERARDVRDAQQKAQEALPKT